MSDQDRGNKEEEHHHSKLGMAAKILGGAAVAAGAYKLYQHHEDKERMEKEAKLYELEHGKLGKK